MTLEYEQPRIDVAPYLRQMGLSRREPSAAYLIELHARHLQNIPFQNVDMIVEGAPRALDETIAEAGTTGRGGTCYQLAGSFLLLLQSLGFEARLVASTIRQANDHVVTRVNIDNDTWLSDVGNGHPYPRPWRISNHADGDEQFRLEKVANGWAVIHGPERRINQVTQLQPTSLLEFEPQIQAHHSEDSYGPFRNGLRIIRGPNFIRDRHVKIGESTAILQNRRELVRAAETLGVEQAILVAAIEILARRSPASWRWAMEDVGA